MATHPLVHRRPRNPQLLGDSSSRPPSQTTLHDQPAGMNGGTRVTVRHGGPPRAGADASDTPTPPGGPPLNQADTLRDRQQRRRSLQLVARERVVSRDKWTQ